MTYVCSGLSEDFDTFVPSITLPSIECRNFVSARRAATDVHKLIETEC